ACQHDVAGLVATDAGPARWKLQRHIEPCRIDVVRYRQRAARCVQRDAARRFEAGEGVEAAAAHAAVGARDGTAVNRTFADCDGPNDGARAFTFHAGEILGTTRTYAALGAGVRRGRAVAQVVEGQQ